MKKSAIIIFVVLMLIFTSSIAFAAGGTNEALANFQEVVGKYGDILMAFALSTSVLIFIIHFIRLANSYDHPFLRRQVQRDIFITGIVVAMIGAIRIIGAIVAATTLYTP